MKSIWRTFENWVWSFDRHSSFSSLLQLGRLNCLRNTIQYKRLTWYLKLLWFYPSFLPECARRRYSDCGKDHWFDFVMRRFHTRVSVDHELLPQRQNYHMTCFIYCPALAWLTSMVWVACMHGFHGVVEENSKDHWWKEDCTLESNYSSTWVCKTTRSLSSSCFLIFTARKPYLIYPRSVATT